MYENWKLITSSTWKNSINATIGDIGLRSGVLLIIIKAYKSF